MVYNDPFHVFNTLGARNSLERSGNEGIMSSQVKPFQIRKLDEQSTGGSLWEKECQESVLYNTSAPDGVFNKMSNTRDNILR